VERDAMTVTVILSAADAERVVPFWGALSSRQRSIHWITTPEPFVCPTCHGRGWHPSAMWMSDVVTCVECDGTGLPDVEIVSVGGADRRHRWSTVHGVVTIGAAVPIVGPSDDRNGQHRIIVALNGVWITSQRPGPPLDITDQFGGKATPGMWAHEVLGATP